MPDGRAAAREDPGPGPAATSAPDSDLRARKRALRAQLRAARRRRAADHPEQAEPTAARLAELMLDLPEIRSAQCVAAYASLPDEPGTEPLRAALRAAGRRVLLPIVLPDGVLDWGEDDGGPLTPPTRLGGAEPTGPRLGRLAIRQADAVIVPALAVDTLGARIGYGGGYYDRALALLTRQVPLIVLLHADEVLDAAVEPLPVQPHDIRMHIAVTPDGTLSLPRPAAVP